MAFERATNAANKKPIMSRLTCIQTSISRTIQGDEFLVGRSPEADLVVFDTTCSRAHFRITRRGEAYWLEPLSDKPTLLNGRPIAGATLLRHRATISAGDMRFLFEHEDRQGPATQVAVPTASAESSPGTVALPVGMRIAFGRDRDDVAVKLDHLQVSRRHAAITRSSTDCVIEDLGSFNGTYVNGNRIQRARVLEFGDRINIGPFEFIFSRDHLAQRWTTDKIEFRCVALTRTLRRGNRTLLKDISFLINPGEFACIIGPTGAGKSTLLNALSHRENPAQLVSSGQVLVNGSNLYSEFDRLKQQIAVVPQREILFDALPLRDALRFTARLRLPPESCYLDTNRRIDETLELVQLADRRATPIAHLSGGERKRAALANEILAQPGLLFLDEVTSALDELTDSEMMRLFRRIADTGKTVVCISHSLTFVPRDCHVVLALTRFGRLAFFGPPDAAIEYFRLSRLPDIYDKLMVASPDAADEVNAAFLSSSAANDHLHGRNAAHSPPPGTSSIRKIKVAPRLRQRPLPLAQLPTLSRRYAQLLTRDRYANVMRVVQCLLVGLLLGLLFGDLRDNVPASATCAFLLVVSSFWFGCNNAAKELVKERTIYRHERDVSLEIMSYLASKFLLLGAIAVVQAAVLYLVVRYFTNIPGSMWWWTLVAGTTAAAGTALGLAISAAASTEEVAISAVPIALIPQIILAGAIAPLDGIDHYLAKLAITSYWAFEAALEVIDMGDKPSIVYVKATAIMATHTAVAVAFVVCQHYAAAGSSVLRRLIRVRRDA